MKYRISNIPGIALKCLTLHREIPVGDTSELIRIVGQDTYSQGGGDSCFEQNLGYVSGSGIIYPSVPGYALEYKEENITSHVAEDGKLIVEITEDKDHLSRFTDGIFTYFPWAGLLEKWDAPGYPYGEYPYYGAGPLAILLDGPAVYDKNRDAIALVFSAYQISENFKSENLTVPTWNTPLDYIDHFICEFNDITYNVPVKEVVFNSPDDVLTFVRSEPVFLPIPDKNPAGAVRVTAVMQNGGDMPWQNFLLQPLAILDSADGVGPYSGSFVTARRSIGFTFPVTRARWCLGADPLVAVTHGDDQYTIDNTTSGVVPAETKQSFIDQKIYFETSDLEKVYCTDQIESGPFHAALHPETIEEGVLVIGRTGVAVAGEDTAHLKNFESNKFWAWTVADRYVTQDITTEIEKKLCPRCPETKVLSGSCVFDLDRIYNDDLEIYFPKLLEPKCTINEVDFHNYSGWAGTAAKDGQLIFLAFNRALTRWELHAGYKWEVINLMSVPWDENYHLATPSYLIEGTICTVAWKVIYEDSPGGDPLQIARFELWFKKSIDGGITWSDEELITTVSKPVLTRVVQNLTSGRYEVTLNGIVKWSDNGGSTWS
jgi:hypothetical protein